MNYGKPEDDKLPIHEQVRQSRAALCGMAPLTTDESTARCVDGESDIDRISAFVRRYPAFYITGGDARILLDERDDLARRCADLENKVEELEASRNWWRGQCSWWSNQLLGDQQSPKAQGPHSPVAPALSPHDMPAALGDYANEVLTDFSLPEPAQLNEAIPASAASQTSAPDGSAPAPGPIPAQALRYSR